MADDLGEAKRTVWILGSGFSRALGGPLLNELLSQSALQELQLAHPELDLRQEFAKVQRVYAYGLESGLWADAETFLDRLDVAARKPNSGSRRQVRIAIDRRSINFAEPVTLWNQEPIASQSCKVLSGEARRFVALQCARFTDSHDEGLESWQAYRSWFKKIWHLGPNHRIVTLNYDTVLEKLGAEVTLPIEAQSRDSMYIQDVPGANVRVLKLHGSVGWKKAGDSYELAPEDWKLPECDSSEIAIASPGPTKHEIVAGPLKNLWDAAIEAIQQADSIIFVGYRFPPSDAEARSRILGAIGKNKANNELTLNIVLGPNLGSADNVRLQALLRYTAQNCGRADLNKTNPNNVFGMKQSNEPRFSIIEHSLWAEDFLTVWEPRLTGSV
jgi:hypothetical protein